MYIYIYIYIYINNSDSLVNAFLLAPKEMMDL